MAKQIDITFGGIQEHLFFGSTARKRVMPKGRRVGLTRGYAHYCIDLAYYQRKAWKILWIDTVNQNIDRYVERYFLPCLGTGDGQHYKWRSHKRELKLLDTVVDLRSADRPENIEGFGYNLILINEAGIVLKNRYLWENAILPMSLDYGAQIIVGGTPKGRRDKKTHEDALFFEIMKKGKEKIGGWELICRPDGAHYTPYDSEFIDDFEVDELIQELSPQVKKQEIDGQFVDLADSNVFDKSWWRYYDWKPRSFGLIIQSWDTAFKKSEENDFSVCTTWGIAGSQIFLLDWYREHLNFPELKKVVQSQYEKFQADLVLIEDKASGQDLIPELQGKIAIEAIQPRGDKVERAHACTPVIAQGRVLVPRNEKWAERYMNVCADFPNGEEDDTIDSTSQALNYLKKGSTKTEYHTVETAEDWNY